MNFKRPQREDVGIDLTSLIDVVFMLLIFFMVTTSFDRIAQINVKLPQASTDQRETLTESIEVTVDADDQVYIRGQRLINTQLGTIREALRESVRTQEEVPVVISADAKATHQAVIKIMDAARQAGLVRITFATRKLQDDTE
ncbi:MAG: biopolymer transporter [Gammaproteobacteria bacterium RIFCSPLOWO2_02_FULL_61_13]|nr:MAG: biopolymer transporter [Gammaproteobacteria bacterium RIFCSPLOWO2_02_FULL_61_13]